MERLFRLLHSGELQSNARHYCGQLRRLLAGNEESESGRSETYVDFPRKTHERISPRKIPPRSGCMPLMS